MAKEKDVVVVIISQEQRLDLDYKAPRANWWFIDAMGNHVFVKCTDKSVAQERIDSEYGVGKYTLNACKQKQAKGELSCRGFNNSASRKGAMQHKLGII